MMRVAIVVAFLAIALFGGAQAWAGPKFDGRTVPVVGGGGIPGPMAIITHEANSTPPGGMKTQVYSNLGSNVPIDALPVSNFGLSVLGSTSTADGGIGHFTNSADSGYAMVGFPRLMGVSQSGGPALFSAPSELKVDFMSNGMKWDVESGTQWNPPLFVYQLFVVAANFTAASEEVTFNATFEYRVDDNADGVAENMAMLSLPRTITSDGNFPHTKTEVIFGAKLLRTTAIPSGAVYQVLGDVSFTAKDPIDAQINLVDLRDWTWLHKQSGLPTDLRMKFDAIGLPQQLRQVQGGGMFVGIPEPTTLAMLAMGGLLMRRRR